MMVGRSASTRDVRRDAQRQRVRLAHRSLPHVRRHDGKVCDALEVGQFLDGTRKVNSAARDHQG
jgi:hypothetical protein